jgi:hypothetical protein
VAGTIILVMSVTGVLLAFERHPLFISAALPYRVNPPIFNRYDVGMSLGTHLDNSVRQAPGTPFRSYSAAWRPTHTMPQGTAIWDFSPYGRVSSTKPWHASSTRWQWTRTVQMRQTTSSTSFVPSLTK